MEGYSGIFLILGFGITQLSMCVSLVINLPDKDTFLPDNSFINNTALSVFQCIDICSRFQFCKSINFIKEEGNCMLNYADDTETGVLSKTGSHYIRKDQFPDELLPVGCVSHDCSSNDLCVTNGSCSQWRFVNCGPPEEDPDAIIQFASTMVFSKASYRCKVAPLTGSGSGQMQCTSYGKWTDHGIKCPRFVNCGPPPSDEFSTTEYFSTVTYSTATYHCKRPYPGQPGSATIECSEETGAWTDHGISCATTCMNPPFIRAEQHVSYIYDRGPIMAQYSCKSFNDSAPTPSCPLSICTAPDTWRIGATLSCSPLDCFNRARMQYNGRVSCTVTGRTCQVWNSNSPHWPTFRAGGADGNTNFCRPLDNFAPWCYTTDPGVRWEYCPVQDC